jgi:5-methylcytosine-specific restriction protein B
MRKSNDNILAVERRVQNPEKIPPITTLPVVKGSQFPKWDGIKGRIREVLEHKSQVILYGPPGTGKTYWAEKAALDLAAFQAYGKFYDQLMPEQQVEIRGNAATGFVRTCCFHPAYGYEDFLEGYRPEPMTDGMSFVLQPGIFKQLCKDAQQQPDKHFYLIIDEINRGDIPRIFGELLTVLEKDKRGRKIILPLSREEFSVPSNVFVIGTMNTADRSISLLDAALRRRFGFIELMPDSLLFGNHSIDGIPLALWFDALNARICEHVGKDARNLQIGHSYLLPGGKLVKDMASFKRSLQDEIIPLLEEYCYQDFTALQKILGPAFIGTGKQVIRHELFEDGREVELAQALLAPCPEISASAPALASDKLTEEEQANDDDEGDSK